MRTTGHRLLMFAVAALTGVVVTVVLDYACAAPPDDTAARLAAQADVPPASMMERDIPVRASAHTAGSGCSNRPGGSLYTAQFAARERLEVTADRAEMVLLRVELHAARHDHLWATTVSNGRVLTYCLHHGCGAQHWGAQQIGGGR